MRVLDQGTLIVFDPLAVPRAVPGGGIKQCHLDTLNPPTIVDIKA